MCVGDDAFRFSVLELTLSHTVVAASEALVDEIEAWLDAEEAGYGQALNDWYDDDCAGPQPVRGFRCNWDVTKDRWRRGIERLDVLTVGSRAVGFLSGTDILEIKPDSRGLGYGRMLAQFMLDRLFAEGHSVAEIGIAPASAKPFWIAMGFTPVEERPDHGAGIYAYKLLPRRFELGSGERVPYGIEFFSERGRYETPPRPFGSYSGMGELIKDGSVQLPERIVCMDPLEDQQVDYFARLTVRGQDLIFDKVKRETVRRAGVLSDPGYNYYVDSIRPVQGD
ncbi:hypothetical protein ACU5AX_18210 [Sphingomonas sp. XXL09]|uniref:hypothetical protein n=1 Tax=Sphingomonas sp. XXL09 TaxID=3457787 RepID=UPI00406BAD06